MASSWYVVQVYAGYENRVDLQIKKKRDSGDFPRGAVLDVKIPVEESTELRDGKKRTQMRKVFPGYILLELDLTDENWRGVCHSIRTINGVSGFVGTADTKKQPTPLKSEDARNILARSGEIKGEKAHKPRTSFSVSEQVKIIGGPFDSFVGTIDEVNNEKSKLKVMVGIFGRNTPVEVDFTQVEKV